VSNVNKPSGLTPHSYLNGTKWTGECRTYYVAAGQTSPIAIGDPVTPTNDSDSNGVPGVTLATGGDSNFVLGSVVGIMANSYANHSLPQFSPAKVPASSSVPYYIAVSDDPNLLYTIQEDSIGYTLQHSDVWGGFDLVAGTDNGYVSGWQLDSSTAGASLKQLQVIGLLQQGGNSIGVNAKWLVRISYHPWQTSSAGSVTQILSRTTPTLSGVPSAGDIAIAGSTLFKGPDGNVYYVSPDHTAYVMVGQLPGTVSLEQVGCVGDGSTDDTTAFNLACGGKWQRVLARPNASYALNSAVMANGVTLSGSAGQSYTAVPDDSYILPKLVPASGATIILNLNNQIDSTKGRGNTIEFMCIDGLNSTANCISAGSAHLTLISCQLTNGIYGLGGQVGGGGSAYTRSLRATSCMWTNCSTAGLANLIDSEVTGGILANSAINYKAIPGSNSNRFSNCRFEFAQTGENVRLDGSGGAAISNINFSNCQFDRGWFSGLYANNVTHLQMSNCMHRRAGAAGSGSVSQNAHLAFDNSSWIEISNADFLHGTDDGGGGNDTPLYNVQCNNVVTNFIWNGGDGSQGYTSAFISYNSGKTSANIPGHKIHGVGGVENYDPFSLLKNTGFGRTYQSFGFTGTLNASGGNTTVTLTQSGINTSSRGWATLTAYNRDVTNGTLNALASFHLLNTREGGSASIAPATLVPFGEVGTAGSIGTSGSVITLAIGTIAADASSFVVTVTNVHATKQFQVWLELT